MATPEFIIVNNPNPAEYAVAVTPSNTTDLTNVTRALYIGGAGDVTVDMPDGSTVLFANALAGTILPIRVKRVRSTGTAATGIVALF